MKSDGWQTLHCFATNDSYTFLLVKMMQWMAPALGKLRCLINILITSDSALMTSNSCHNCDHKWCSKLWRHLRSSFTIITYNHNSFIIQAIGSRFANNDYYTLLLAKVKQWMAPALGKLTCLINILTTSDSALMASNSCHNCDMSIKNSLNQRPHIVSVIPGAERLIQILNSQSLHSSVKDFINRATSSLYYKIILTIISDNRKLCLYYKCFISPSLSFS